jgi:hypothetical protein
MPPTLDDPDFHELHSKWHKRLLRSAQYQRLPRMAPDEVYCEMIETLYNAYLNHKPASVVKFDAYFWTLWRNRKSRLYSQHYGRGKDSESVTSPDDMIIMSLDEAPPPLTIPPLRVINIDRDERLVWVMIAVGYTPTEIMVRLDLSNRRFYRLIHAWREHADHLVDRYA